MAGCAVTTGYWNQLKHIHYIKMQDRHTGLWKYVHDFIKDKGITSCLEVGCGVCSPVDDWVDDWQGIDLNKNVDCDFHIDFASELFTELTLSKKDLLLSCSVIEHCEKYETFLENISHYNAKWSLITFFRGWRSNHSVIAKGKGDFYNNRYAQSDITNKCEELDLDFSYIRTGRDNILIIKGKN